MALAACVALAVSLTAVASADAKTVWLCKPGAADNPCRPTQKTTVLSPVGDQLAIDKVKAPRRPKIDCFYVYPTVSDQPTPNANLNIDPEERSVALYQAARFSTQCRVFAPMYRQITLDGLDGGLQPDSFAIAYSDVQAAWKTYLKKFNKGRGVVLLGHSQGTFMLTQLIQEQIDPKPSKRRKLISALLLGGNVTVADGSDVGGSFDNVRACHSKRQLGCVVAFSTFNAPVPEDATFGRAGPGLDVLCTNPSNFKGSGELNSEYPSEPFAPGSTIAAGIAATVPAPPQVSTPWLQFKAAYSGECSSADDANVLQITGQAGAPELRPIPNAGWGLHLADVNIALGNLTALVHSQAKKFLKKNG